MLTCNAAIYIAKRELASVFRADTNVTKQLDKCVTTMQWPRLTRLQALAGCDDSLLRSMPAILRTKPRNEAHGIMRW